MAGPWEKFQKTEAAPEAAKPTEGGKPWERFKAPDSTAEPTFAERGLETLKTLGRGVAAVGRKVDSITGAPTRAAIGAIQDDKNPVTAFASQFGEDPELAPTGKEIAAKAGLSKEEYIPTPFVGLDMKNIKVSPAGVAGLGIDVAADPTNVIPTSALAKFGAKAGITTASEAARLGIKGTAAGVDAVTGTKIASGGVKYLKEQKDAAKLALSELFNPKRANDFPDMVRIAQRNGVRPDLLPEAVEFGPESIITRASRTKAEGPLGQKQLERFAQGLDQTKKATRDQITKLGGGRILTPQEAGDIIREGYDEAVSRLMSESTDTYRSIAARNPGLRLNPQEAAKLSDKLTELGQFAESRVKMGMTSGQKGQAKQLQEAVDSLKSVFSDSWEQAARGDAVGQPLLDDMVQRLQILGEAAFKKKNGLDLDPPDVARLRGLYGDMRESIIGTIEKDIAGGDALAKSLRENNAKISKFMDDRGPIERALGNKNLSDEGLYRALVENGDSLKLGALNEILAPEKMQQLKGAFLNGIIRPDFDDDFTFGRAINSIKTKRDVFENLLSPEEIKEFTDLVRLGDRFGQPIMSTSGTGASNVFKNIKEGVTNAVVTDSFIESLKSRARANAPKVKLSDGSDVPFSPEALNTLSPSARSMLRSRPFDRRLKGSQAYSVSPTEDNEQRREAIRRRAEKQGDR